MGFEADREMIAVTLERLELPEPVDDAGSHRRPIVVVAPFHGVLAMAVADPLPGQKIVAIGKRPFAAGSGVPRIPVQHEMGGLDGIENLCGLSSGGSIESGIVFQKQGDALLAGFISCFQKFFVDRGTIWLLIFQAPEIEAAHAIGLEGLCQLDGTLEHFILLIECEVGVKISMHAVFRRGSTFPFDLEERTGDIGYAQSVFLDNAAGLGNFVCVEVEDVLVPHAAELDPLHAEFVGGNFAGVAEVLRDLVVDHGNAEWGGYGLSLRGFLLSFQKAPTGQGRGCRRSCGGSETAQKFATRVLLKNLNHGVATSLDTPVSSLARSAFYAL